MPAHRHKHSQSTASVLLVPAGTLATHSLVSGLFYGSEALVRKQARLWCLSLSFFSLSLLPLGGGVGGGGGGGGAPGRSALLASGHKSFMGPHNLILN